MTCTMHAFPALKQIFLKKNTAIPSSAAVERPFSAAKHIFTSNRTRLTDENVELLLPLKCNPEAYNIMN